MKLLPDTNIWIELLKKRNIIVAARFAATPANEIVTCAVVRSEFMHGAEKYVNPPERRAKVKTILSAYPSLPFDDACADKYAEIRHDLELRACIIGPYDLQIAAIALVRDLTLVTGNADEFKRVPGLRVIDWSSDAG